MLPVTRTDWREAEELEHALLHLPPNPPHCLARCRSEEQVLRDNAMWLIEHLYVPDAEVGACFAGRDMARAGVPDAKGCEKEPINWGDLGVSEVVPHGDGWMITLEEASADACPSLCEYVRSWLERWGWSNVVVATTW